MKKINNILWQGRGPLTKLEKAADKAIENLEDLQEYEDLEMQKIADRRRYEELSNMPISNMNYDDLAELDRLRHTYDPEKMEVKKQSYFLTKEDKEQHVEPHARMRQEIEESLSDLIELADEHGKDITKPVSELRKLVDVLYKLTSEGEPADVEKGIKKGIAKYKARKTMEKLFKSGGLGVELNKRHCTEKSCHLHIDTDIPSAGLKKGQILYLNPDGRWNAK